MNIAKEECMGTKKEKGTVYQNISAEAERKRHTQTETMIETETLK